MSTVGITMTEAIAIFLVQFTTIYLLGLQSLNVRDGHTLGAAVTSVFLGLTGFTATSYIGGLEPSDLMSVVGFSFVLAGPLGITASMKTHKHAIKILYGGRYE